MLIWILCIFLIIGFIIYTKFTVITKIILANIAILMFIIIFSIAENWHGNPTGAGGLISMLMIIGHMFLLSVTTIVSIIIIIIRKIPGREHMLGHMAIGYSYSTFTRKAPEKAHVLIQIANSCFYSIIINIAILATLIGFKDQVNYIIHYFKGQ